MALRTGTLARPDLSGRPHGCTVEATLGAPPDAVYLAFTEGFERWFARPASVRMVAEPDAPFFFETEHEGARHPHYGRFLSLETDRLVELTWVTGAAGTHGAETVVRLELESVAGGTRAHLTHEGFVDEADAERHHQAWPHVLAHLDDQLAS